jgi:hypothetical protein
VHLRKRSVSSEFLYSSSGPGARLPVFPTRATAVPLPLQSKADESGAGPLAFACSQPRSRARWNRPLRDALSIAALSRCLTLPPPVTVCSRALWPNSKNSALAGAFSTTNQRCCGASGSFSRPQLFHHSSGKSGGRDSFRSTMASFGGKNACAKPVPRRRRRRESGRGENARRHGWAAGDDAQVDPVRR